MVLVAALLPCGVAVAVPDVEADAAVDGPAQLLQLQELRAVVGGDALEYLPEVFYGSLQTVKDGPDGGRLAVRQLEDQLPAGQPLGEGQETGPGPGLAYDEVHLPVPPLQPPADKPRPVRYAGKCRVGDPALRLLLFLLLALLPQVLIGKLEEHLLLDVAVQGIHGDSHGEAPFPGRRQCRRWGVPVPDDLVLQELGVVVVAPDLQRPALGRLVVPVDLLGLVR